jgi:cytochrome b561
MAKLTNVKPVPQYHPLLIGLHWLVALLIITTLGVGFLCLAQWRTDDPRTIGLLRWHVGGGVLILTLMAVRFMVRLRTPRPSNEKTGLRLLWRAAALSHYGFYALVFLIAGTGYTTAVLAGVPATLFGRSEWHLPPSFDRYPTFAAHAILATLLANLIVVHVLAAFYHQLVRKDDLLSRMLWGRQGANRP